MAQKAGEIFVKINADVRDFSKGFDVAASQARTGSKKIEQGFSGIGNSLKGLAAPIAAVFATDQILSFGKEVINTRAQFQKFEAVLKNTLGSGSEAQLAFAQIKDYAAETNFQVTEITDSFIRLSNRGIVPTKKDLEDMGNLTNALGKDFQQLTEAILDVNNTERWTELGIKVKTVGDTIQATFKGVTITTEKTERGALEMVNAFAQLDGVAGTTAAIAGTLGGQISNLEDNFASLRNEIGKLTESDAKGFFSSLNSLIKTMTSNLSKQNDPAGALLKTGNYAEATRNLLALENQFKSLRAEAQKRLDDNGFFGPRVKKELESLAEAIERQKQVILDLQKASTTGSGSVAESSIETLKTLQTQLESLKTQRLTAPFEDAKELTRQIEEIQKRIEAFTKVNETQDRGLIADITKQIEEYQKKANSAFDKDLIAQYNDRIKELNKELQELNGLSNFKSPIDKNALEDLKAFFDEADFLSDAMFEDLNFAENINAEIDEMLSENGIKKFQKRSDELIDASRALSAALQASFAEVATAVGESLGDALSGKKLDISKTLFSLLSSITKRLGETLIGIGVGIAAIKASIESLNPYLALAGGVALIALSQALKNGLVANSVGLKDGGIIPGGYPNDNFFARLSSGEAVVDINKLYDSIEKGGGGGGSIVGRISGDQLLLIQERAQAKRNRLR